MRRWISLALLLGTGCYFSEADLPPEGPVGPGALLYAASAYDSARHRLVLQGGYDPNTKESRASTWEYDGDNWVRVSTEGPGPRIDHAMVYDEALKEVVLYGGGASRSDSTGCDETWTFNGARWRQLPIEGPGCRQFHVLAYDAGRAEVLLFGGSFDCSSGRCQETWVFDGTAWRLVPPP